jgi:hypothetical protein
MSWMQHSLFSNLAICFRDLAQPRVPSAIIDENTIELRVPPAVMTLKYDAPTGIVFFSTEQGSPAGYFDVTSYQPGTSAQFRLGTGDPIFIDELANHLAKLITDYAPALQHALDNPR